MTAPITPAQLVQDRTHLSGVTLAPDGSRFAYVRTAFNKETGKNESQIWLANVDGSDRHQITHVGTGNANPAWAPDGTRLAFTSQREGDKPSTIAILPLNGGEAEIVKQHAMPPLSLSWSPDGTQLAYPLPVDPENPDETPRDPKAPAPVRVVQTMNYKLDGLGYRGEIRNQLVVLDVASGTHRQLTTGLVDYMNPRWSPDGSTIAAATWDGNPLAARIALVDVAAGDVTPIGEYDAFVGAPSWSPSGASIIFDLGLYTYTIIDVASRTSRIVSPDVVFMPDGLYNPEPGPIWLGEDELLVQGFLGTRSSLWTLDLKNGATSLVAKWDAINAGMNPTPDGSTIIQSTQDLSGVEGVVSVDRATGERTLLFEENRELINSAALAEWELVSVENDGFPVEGILLKPANFDERKNYPVILDIHGGPQGAHLQNINQIAQAYASAGFVVLLPNPRGSTGYGKTYLDGCVGAWGDGDWTDLLALLDHVLERPYLDSDRTGVSGYSYGGFMTAWAIGQTTRFKAAVCGAPVFDLESFFGTSDVGHVFGPQQWGGTPWESPEWLAAHSPSSFVQNATTPTLVVCGESDDRCPIGQSEQLFISLSKLGVDTEFARYPGGSHGFVVRGEPSHQLDFLERSTAWLKTYLGDPA